MEESGLILGWNRTHARLQVGTRVRELKPFSRSAKIPVIGAISLNKVLTLMTMNDSIDGRAFSVFIDQCLCPQLSRGAVVVMDNLPANKLAAIVPMIEAVEASVISLSPYSPDFNPIELWWSQLKSFLRRFAPTTPEIIDRIIAVALNLINPEHFKNWFANCCYCTL